jgi:hypothetical protein
VNFLKADTGSFNRLLASVGLILVGLAFLAPWLFLRETAVLEIKAADIAALTPKARDVIRERQDRIGLVQVVMPWAALVLLAGGAVMVFYGARGMKRLQPWEDMEARARAEQAQASIGTQTEAERDERVREEVDVAALEAVLHATEPPYSPEPAPQVSPEPAQQVSPEPTTGERSGADQQTSAASLKAARVAAGAAFVRARQIETAVLDRLAGVDFGPRYEFRREAKVTARTSQDRLLLDGLLRSTDGSRPDVVIEIKAPQTVRFPRQIADQVLAEVVRYTRMTGRRAEPWLIVVVEAEDAAAAAALESRLMNSLGNEGAVAVVARDQLDTLEKMARALLIS